MPATTRGTAKRQNTGATGLDDGGRFSSKRYKADEATTTSLSYRTSSCLRSAAMQFLPPGKRLLPQIVDELAADDPQGVWLSIPLELDSADTFCDVSYSQLANAVDRAAWWIHDTVGDGMRSGAQTLAYLGPTDSRYLVFLIAAVKAGHRLLLPSTRNAEVAQRALLEATGCSVVLCAESERRKVEETLQVSAAGLGSLAVHVVPEQDEILDSSPSKKYMYSKSFDEEKLNAFVILHTSGTGGQVTPIELPHSYYAYEDLVRTEFTNDGVLTFAPLRPDVRCLYTGPLYHAGAILFTLIKSLLLKATMLLPPAGVPVTPEVVEKCLIRGRADMLGTAPSVLEELCSSTARIKCLERLSCIFCGSGPMPKTVGDAVRAVDVKLLHIYGSTETALLPQLPLEDPESDWQYFSFHPASGVGFVSLGKNGLFELVIGRIEGKTSQPCFEVFPELEEYHTRDTFSAHPSKPGLWKFEGRIDDILTLTNGEKFCPSAAEELIASHPDVISALIVGQGRFQPTLVVNMVDSSKTSEQVIDSLWPLIEQANSQIPGYARIGRGYVVVSDKPFLKTPKGTIRRHATEELLQYEINAVYEQSGSSSPLRSYPISDVRSLECVQDFLRLVVSTQISAGVDLDPKDDLFAHGLDSLRAAALVSLVNTSLEQALGTTFARVKPQLFYENRTLSRLATALHSLANSRDPVASDQEAWENQQKVLLKRYTQPAISGSTSAILMDNKAPGTTLDVVLLTGSTGTLGTFLLHELLRNSETSHVYCIDRSPNAEVRYAKAFPHDDAKVGRVTFLHSPKVDAQGLGVQDSVVYARLFESVTRIIHNAWPVNFNLPLQSFTGLEGEDASFECHLAAVRRLINFAAMAPRKPQLVFVSSLSSVLRYKDPGSGSIPEAIIEDPAAPSENGYGRSKWLVERMLDMAAKSGALPTKPKIVRIGQIAGPTPQSRIRHGSNVIVWPKHEIIPSIICSAATVGALPESLRAMEKVRWVPLDNAARIVVEIAHAQETLEEVSNPGALVFNVTYIQSGGLERTWAKDMLPMILSRLEKTVSQPVEVVPLKEWLRRVEQTGITESEVEGETGNPAMKLISFYEELVHTDIHEGLGTAIDTANTHQASHAFRSLQPINPNWMVEWMAAWRL